MDLSRPLQVVTPTVDGDILALLASADEHFTPGQMQQLIGRHSPHGVRLAANRLAEQGVVLREVAGNARLYRLNRKHLAAEAVIALALLRQTFLERLAESFAQFSVSPRFAALFGSVATGSMQHDSDIDLLVVRRDDVDADDPAWLGQITRMSADVTSWTGNDGRILEMSETEVADGLRNEEQVLADVSAEGIVLFGDRTYLRSRLTRR